MGLMGKIAKMVDIFTLDVFPAKTPRPVPASLCSRNINSSLIAKANDVLKREERDDGTAANGKRGKAPI